MRKKLALRRHLAVAVLSVLVLATLSGTKAHAQTKYKFIDLGTLPGASHSGANGCNDLGHVVGTSSFTGQSEHAFFWADTNNNDVSDPGEMIDLGALGGAGNNSVALAVNDSDEVVGYSDYIGTGIRRAFIWDQSNGMRSLNDLNKDGVDDHPDWVLTGAHDINDNRQAVGGGAHTVDGVTQMRGFLLDLQAGTIVGFGPPDAFNWIDANSVNVSGQVVGWTPITGQPQQQGYFYSNGVFSVLNSLNPTGRGAYANALNNFAEITGAFFPSISAQAFYLSSPTSTPVNLGTLGGFSVGVSASTTRARWWANPRRARGLTLPGTPFAGSRAIEGW